MPRTLPRPLRALVSIVVVGLVLGCAPASDDTGHSSDDAADLVITGGKIVTVDDANPEVEALAAKDGKIVALGSAEEIAAFVGDSTRVVELAEGQVAIPGFIEGHGHFMGLGDFRSQLDLRFADSWQDIVDQVAAAAAELPAGSWIRGRGWHQDKWSTPPEPNLEGFPLHDALSAAAPDHPVLLTHASGHALFANAKAMELAGVDGSTADPQGGEILHDGSGEPTGLFRETAQNLIHAARGDGPGADELSRAARLAAEESLAKGITSFQDAGSSFPTVDFLRQETARDDWVGPRLWMMVRDSNEALEARLAEVVEATRDNDTLTVAGIKLSIDGALGARGAWLLEPYSDSPESTGLNLVPIPVAERTAEIAQEVGVQLCIHAIGDRANREVLDLFEKALGDRVGEDHRWRIEHAQHLHLDDIPRFAELGVVASMQAVHCTSDGPWVPDRLGDQRSEEGAYVWRKLLDAGVVVSNGTDAPVEDVDPLASFYSSVSRLMANGERFYPDQVMNRMEALRSYTLSAAFAAFEDDVKGSLEVGKLADVVVLSQDILTVPEESIPDTTVVHTIVGGEVVGP